MKYRRSGGSRLEVSTLCLGAMTFGEADEKSFMHGVGADEATAFAIMDLTPFVSNQAQYSLLVRELEREHVLEALGAVSAEAGRSVSQVALAWMAQRPGVSSVIFGARTLAQLDDNLGAADLALTDAQMKRLDEASAFEVGYPYDFIQSAQGRW